MGTKIKLNKILPIRIAHYYKLSKLHKTYRNEFSFDHIDIDRLTKQNIFDIVDRKGLKTTWIKKLELINEGHRVIWKYRGKEAIYIYEDKFCMMVESDDIHTNNIYRCASILREHGFLHGMKRVMS